MKKLLLIGLFAFSGMASAFNDAEILLLRDAANNEPSIDACIIAGDDGCVANWFNANSTFVVWRTQVTKSEYQTKVSSTATTFDWASAGGYISRSVAERDAWNTLFSGDSFNSSVNPSMLNVRNAFNDIFSGTGAGAVNNRAHVLAISKRFANHAEKALATGTGTDQTPGTLTFQGTIRVDEVHTILGR